MNGHDARRSSVATDDCTIVGAPSAASHRSDSITSWHTRQSESETGSSGTLNSADALSSSSVFEEQNSEKSSSWTLSAPSSYPAEEPRHLSTTRLCFAHIGAAMTLFLATTDSTVVSTSLPTITSDLQASHSQYTWVGVAYLLTQTACQPLYGRISDLLGRKCILYCSIFIFALGSLLCGVAQNITWLIAARGVAGVGGGGIVSAVWVITAEIVPEQKRAKWSQALSITWSCSAVAGPVLGGLFSSTHSSAINWRWIFYLNLPVCFAAFVVLELSLRTLQLGSSQQASWKALRQHFDFVGLLLFVGGTSAIILGLSFDHYSGTALSTLSLIISGGVLLGTGAVYEINTKRDALFPVAAFKDRTAVVILIVTFLHQFAFNAGTFYLALYFQAVNGATPVGAGLLVLPYSLGSSLISMPAAWFIGYRQSRCHNMSGQKWVICLGLAVSTLGFGIMCLLCEGSPKYLQVVCPLVAGLGIGMLFHAPHQVFTRILQSRELASGTSAFFLVRFTGATVGLSAAGAIFDIRLLRLLPPSYKMLALGSAFDWGALKSLTPVSTKIEVLHAISKSIESIWMVCAPCLGVAMMVGLSLLYNFAGLIMVALRAAGRLYPSDVYPR
ncbi:MFS general substrate transporter [Neolentinus lepideus HHB14362 ss-1]|uniref:MFS general substrate transporter n=1 Tax=Neolentinus lepideus HHB14362 ss-1 TaxID=1314782 RepID=A0A165NAY2_9AGAM|nr:MFS general substrate transporter [Neolentinus lepideus HHB14362 ss-1]